MYKIEGRDKNGDFMTTRSYNDFLVLWKTLQSRWPGCLIPYLPEKSVIVATVFNKRKLITAKERKIW